MATTTAPPRTNGISRVLVSSNLLSAEAANTAQQEAATKNISFLTHIIEKKLITARVLASTVAHEFGAPLYDLDAADFAHAPIKLVNEKLIRRHTILPLYKRGNRLFIAISDPTDLQAIDDIKFHTGMLAEAIIVEHDKLSKAIEKQLEGLDTSMKDISDMDLENLDISSGDEETKDADSKDNSADDAPVVRFINKILLDAINKGASDVHFEPYEQMYRVRWRLDGILNEVANPPVALATRMAARLKVMSKLDIAERRVPQDGRIKLKISKSRAIDFRVSVCPTLWGEKVVLRILDPSSAKLGIDALGYEPHQKELYLKSLSRPQGMILVTGPTGSGKTVSLYTGLNILNTADRNISTAEDPAEINLPGVNQVNVNTRVGLTFPACLRSFLRQDPDVIMVGEIRDLETAEVAIKAAQTGHLVLSTLHTNDAPQTLTRLANMGVPPFNIASSITLIIAQRLARRLCSQCKQKLTIPREALLKMGFLATEVDQVTVYGPKGCEACNEGYKGRLGIYQVMPMTEAIGRIIMGGGNSMQIADQAASEGVIDLRRAGLNKVKEGLTSLEEINRITVE